MADRFGVCGLKVEVEACLVKTTTFTVENVMDHLHFADMKNCALLKEAILDNKVEVITKSWITTSVVAICTSMDSSISSVTSSLALCLLYVVGSRMELVLPGLAREIRGMVLLAFDKPQ